MKADACDSVGGTVLVVGLNRPGIPNHSTPFVLPPWGDVPVSELPPAYWQEPKPTDESDGGHAKLPIGGHRNSPRTAS